LSVPVRRLALVASVVFAIACPALQALTGWGLSAGEFAADGERTLRAASYAFSIWSVIYAGLIAYGVWQVLPRNAGSPVLQAMAWPSAAALVGIGAWIWASAADLKAVTVLVIFLSAAAAIFAAWTARSAKGADRWLAAFPLAALAGWLTVASALNLITSLTAWGLIQPDQETTAGIAGVVAVLAVSLAVLWRARLAIYGAPVAWGLVAVFVAEQARHPASGWSALVAAAIVLLAAGLTLRRPSAAPR
jgi:hypothetical protein